MTNRLPCFDCLMTRGAFTPPLTPPSGYRGPKVGVPNSGVGPLDDLGSPLGLPSPPTGTPHGSLRGDPGPPTARRKDANVSLRFADLRFVTPPIEFRTLWRSDLSRKAIKANLILSILKSHCSSQFLCVSSLDGPKVPPRPLSAPFLEKR